MLYLNFDPGLYPRPPEDVEVKTIEQYSIVIDWQEPGGGPNITSYTVEHSLDNSIWTKVMASLTLKKTSSIISYI
jgi:hypothetical protein